MTRVGIAVLVCTLPQLVLADDAPAPSPEPAPAVEKTSQPPPPAPSDATARPTTPSREIRIEVPNERSRNNKLLCGGLLGVGVVASALGLYWHLDSREASNAVSADYFTGEAWTEAHINDVERAERSKTRATVSYAIGGAFLIGAVVTWILTDPGSETEVIRTGVTVTPTQNGGTVVGKMWSF